MFEWTSLLLFITVAAALVFVPGPNTLYIIAQSIKQGRKAGIISSLGVQVGTLVHISAAAFGLSALLLSSALAFDFVKYAGAAYLIYLGFKTLLTTQEADNSPEVETKSLLKAFTQGIIVNVLNPKSALFFLAFLPQFVDIHRGSVRLQILVLGLILMALGFLSDTIYAALSGSLGNIFRRNMQFLKVQRYFAGSVYLGLGVLTAFSAPNKK